MLALSPPQRPFGGMTSAGFSELLHSGDLARFWVSQVGYASTSSSFGSGVARVRRSDLRRRYLSYRYGSWVTRKHMVGFPTGPSSHRQTSLFA